jgi:adenosylcobinamide kinase/adenosylcobinamide-phosphate guanylyltransferase
VKVLVTGGVRSGKSTHAERLLDTAGPVTYVAPGTREGSPDWDEDWAARVAAHRARRPGAWRTVETSDVAGAVRAAEGDVLVDCLGTWLTATCDELGWDAPDLGGLVAARTDDLVAAVRAAEGLVVLVTNEVGLGVVPEHRSGRLFRDLLGTVNQAVGAACDEVHLVVAGRVLRI